MSDETSALAPTTRAVRHRRGLATLAVAALLVASAAACGTDDGDEPTATDPTSAATASTGTASPSAPQSPSESGSTSAAPSATSAPDPVPSPVVNKAVKAALRDGFPALVPAGVPTGWTVESATYAAKGGGRWRIELTEPGGGRVSLVQATQQLEAFVSANLGMEMQQSGTVDLSGTGSWTVYTGGETAGEATAIVTRIADTSALVVGPSQDAVVELADQLLTAEDAGSGTGDG